MPRHRSFVLLLAVMTSSPTVLSAQQPQARDFLIPGSHNLISIDLEAMRKLGVWDDLEASVLKLAFGQIEKEIGFPLAALDRFEVSAWMPENGGPLEGRQVLIWQGNRELTVHESYDGPAWSAERVGDHDVRRRSNSRGDELFVRVRPELMVFGSAEFIEAALQGKNRAQPLPPDLQSLLSGRERRLGWFVLDLSHEFMRDRFLVEVMGAELSAWPQDDLPTHLSAQILVTGDDDDPHLQLRAVLRHVKDGDGVAASQRAIDVLVAKLRDDSRMRLLQPLLKKAGAVRDHTDAVLQVDFGRSRDAVGNFAALLLPVIGRGGEVESVEAEPATPKKAPADGGK